MSPAKPDSNIVEYPTDVTRVIQPPTGYDSEDYIDLRALLLKVWRGRWIVAISVVVFLALAILAVSQLEPHYKSSAKVMFGIQHANRINVQQVVISPEFDQDMLQNEIEVLSSDTLLQRVVEKLDLEQDPEFNPVIAAEQAQETFWDRIGAVFALPPELKDLLTNMGVISAPEPPPSEEESRFFQQISVVEAVQERLDLRPVIGARVIEISFTADDPQTAANVVNVVADQYIVDRLEAKLESARSATEWLAGRVEGLRLKVQESEEAVEAFRTELSNSAGQSKEITQQQLGALNASLSVARNRSAEIEAQYARLIEAREAGGDLGSVVEFRESSLIQDYREEESELQNRLESLSANHPERAQIITQLERLQARMQEEAELITESVKVELDTSLAQENVLRDNIRELESKSLAQSRDEIGLRQLEREAQAATLLYESLLARLQETAEQEDLQEPDSRVLSPAQPPLEAESNTKKQIVAAASVLGVVVGLGIIFLLDQLNNTFRAPQHIETLTGLAVLATVPAVGKHIRRRDVIKNFIGKPSSSLAEAIRNLRTSILFSNVDKPPKVIMFTSSVPGEGKSTTSMLTAITSRQMGKSAIIVDCDLRLPSVSQLLKIEDNKPGLLSVLEGAASFQEAVYEDAETGLHVLMARPSERKAQVNAADILSSQRFNDLIKTLSKQYDLVVLDTPPALIVTDARILASLVDTIVYAVRWDHTPRDAVLDGLKELKSVKAPLAGVVLTMVNESKASQYVYDGHSYHKGKYRGYYAG